MNIVNMLLELKRSVETATVQGDFLLSVNKFSHRWVFLEELWRDPTPELVRDILKVVLRNFLAELGPFTVFAAGSFTGTSEEESPVYVICREAIQSLGLDEIKLLKMIVEPPTHPESGDETPPGQYVGVFALSIHVELIKQIVGVLRARNCEVNSVVTVVEREPFSRSELSRLGIELIPMIFVDEASGRLQTILETSTWPYHTAHKYFVERVPETSKHRHTYLRAS